MDNVFDAYKAQTFDVIATTMGYDAVCEGVSARVLFNSPSVSETVSDHDYDYGRPTLEFKVGDWPGVKEKIEATQDVTITVRGVDYYAMKITGPGSIAQDGETYKVILEA